MIENSALNDSTTLPDNGGAMGVSGGALGGLSQADLKRGYGGDVNTSPADDAPLNFVDQFPPKAGGFLGRPEGFER